MSTRLSSHHNELVCGYTLSLSLHQSLKGNLCPLISLISVHGKVPSHESCQGPIANGRQVGEELADIPH